MAIFLMKPVEKDNGDLLGGCMVFESSQSGTDIGVHFGGTTLDTDFPEAGWNTDQVSDTEWDDGPPGFKILLYKISGVGASGTTTPTLFNVNASELVSEFWHSNHSNSINGQPYGSAYGNYSPNFGTSTFTTTNEIISFDYSANITGVVAPGLPQRTQSNDNGDVYYNGILLDTSYSSSDDGLAWYQTSTGTNYIANISASNVFDNILPVTNNRKNYKRASQDLANETSTDLIEKYTKLMNLKLLDRLIDVDDYRDAERWALSKLSDSEQTTIKNITRYS